MILMCNMKKYGHLNLHPNVIDDYIICISESCDEDLIVESGSICLIVEQAHGCVIPLDDSIA